VFISKEYPHLKQRLKRSLTSEMRKLTGTYSMLGWLTTGSKGIILEHTTVYKLRFDIRAQVFLPD